MKNPWKKIKSKLIYKNNWTEFYHDKVIRPDGKPGIYGYLKTKGGIGVVAINDKREIYLVEQYRYAPDTYSLEIPKGCFDSYGDKRYPLATAKRELKEECGLTAKKWIKLNKVHTLMGFSNDFVYLFLATELKRCKNSPDDTEAIKVKLIPFAKIEKTIDKITDATSIAAIYLAKEILKIN